MANKPFDETLYRLVEQESPAAGAAELKTRIDAEPEFAAAFDRTRKTVIALQGMGPKPADRSVGTFSQRDFDRLTRGILKGYHAKLAELYLDLGKAYLYEVPENLHGFLGRELAATADKVRPKLNRTRQAYYVVGGDRQLVDVETGVPASSNPLEKSHLCFSGAKALLPRNPDLWYWEGNAGIRSGDLARAKMSFGCMEDLARDESDKVRALHGRSIVAFLEEDYVEQLSLTERILHSNPDSIAYRNNYGMALLNLREVKRGVEALENLYSVASSDLHARKMCVRALSVAEHWDFFRGEEPLRRRFIAAIRVHIGTEAVAVVERVGL